MNVKNNLKMNFFPANTFRSPPMLKVDMCRILRERDEFGLERVRLESTLIKIFTIENDGDP